jgi:hypothetical protein
MEISKDKNGKRKVFETKELMRKKCQIKSPAKKRGLQNMRKNLL